ncbi:MAG: hypothetical protein HY531_02065 [Chloroflexi bacterium]|nr:hypothetical protein [Chloroflexota bacterium]
MPAGRYHSESDCFISTLTRGYFYSNLHAQLFAITNVHAHAQARDHTNPSAWAYT